MWINGEDVNVENPANLPPRICDAILAIDSSAKFTILNDDVDRIEWLESFTPIDKADIVAKYEELKTAFEGG